MSILSLAVIDGEPCVDSRLVANELAINHKNARELIEQYSADFKELGVWRFETAKPSKDSLGGRPEKFFLLNEDQTYFLMTLVRNTDEAVNLKKRLVMAFARYRAKAQPEPLAHQDTITLTKDQYIDLLKMQIDHLQRLVQPGRRGLSTEEKTRIKKFHAQGLGHARIGQHIGRTKGTVCSYLRRVRLGQES